MGAGLRKFVSACICTARSVSLLLALRFSAHGVVRCRRRSIVTAAHPTSPLSSSAPVLFFFLSSASEAKKVPRADDNRLLRHFGDGSLAMLRRIFPPEVVW